MCPFMSVLENMMSVMGEGTDMPCTASIDAICKNPASISAFVSGAAELVRAGCLLLTSDANGANCPFWVLFVGIEVKNLLQEPREHLRLRQRRCRAGACGLVCC